MLLIPVTFLKYSRFLKLNSSLFRHLRIRCLPILILHITIIRNPVNFLFQLINLQIQLPQLKKYPLLLKQYLINFAHGGHLFDIKQFSLNIRYFFFYFFFFFVLFQLYCDHRLILLTIFLILELGCVVLLMESLFLAFEGKAVGLVRSSEALNSIFHFLFFVK